MASKKKSNVPDQYRGFSLQPTRMASLLLAANDDARVSMELFEDVGVENPDGSRLACQTKSTVSGNPVADRSPELWKAFANWSRAVRSGEIDPTQTIFEIYVNKEKSGKFVKLFHGVQNKDQATAAFENARSTLWGDAPKFSKRTNVSASLREHLDEVFETSQEEFKSILPRFQLTCAIKNPEMDLHDQVSKWPTIEQFSVENMVCHIHGWLKNKTENFLEQRRAPVISRQDLMQEVARYYRVLVPSGKLPDLADHPSTQDVLSLLNLPFSLQLDLIKLDPDSKSFAFNSYFRAVLTRTRWSDKDLVYDNSLADLETRLMQAHRDYREEVASLHANSVDELKGRLLLGKCNSYRCGVEGRDVPEYFIPGCFHALANELHIGWHPNYEKLMKS